MMNKFLRMFLPHKHDWLKVMSLENTSLTKDFLPLKRKVVHDKYVCKCGAVKWIPDLEYIDDY